MDLERYRAEADEYLRRLEEECYRHGAGLKDELAAAAIIEEYAHLFGREVVERLGRELAQVGSAGEASHRLRYLYAFTVEGALEAAAREVSDRLGSAEAAATVPFEGRELSYRSVPVALANEADRERRRRLSAARDRVTAEAVNPLAGEYFRTLYGAARELGYSGYLSLCREVASADLQALGRQMQAFLTETEEVYARHLERDLLRISVDPAEAEKQDLGYLFRAPEFDAWFPRDKALFALEATLGGMGIDFQRQKAIIVDDASREKKSPRAFCAPVRPGEEVYLVILPHGGMDDYQALFHEAGHAEHFAYCGPGLAFEYRRLGDNAVTEAFAFTLQYLTIDPTWCGDMLGLNEREYFRFTRFQKLYMLRRYAAKLLYELRLHGVSEGGPAHGATGRATGGAVAGLAGMAPVYARVLGEALRVAHPEVHYLVDVDPGLYAAAYLRAWALSAQLTATLVERFGRRWYASGGAGELLRELWRCGQKYTAEELARELGWPGLSFEPVMSEMAVLAS